MSGESKSPGNPESSPCADIGQRSAHLHEGIVMADVGNDRAFGLCFTGEYKLHQALFQGIFRRKFLRRSVSEAGLKSFLHVLFGNQVRFIQHPQ